MPRKLEFDREEVLHRAMLAFWQQGYENTSMEELVNQLKINRFSIYNSFGDKRSLYLRALEKYDRDVFQPLRRPLLQDKLGKDRLDDYFENLANSLSGNAGDLGCMVQNTGLSELSTDPEIFQYMKTMTRQLLKEIERALQDAKESGDVSSDLEIKTAARHILATVQGLILMRRGSGNPVMLHSQIDFLKRIVRAW